MALFSGRSRVAMGGLLLATSAIVGNVSPAQAATNIEPNVPITFSKSGTLAWALLPTTLTAGDCREIGVNQQPDHDTSSINIQQQPDRGPNIYKVYWHADLYTIQSWQNNDVWHAWFTFKKDPSDVGFQLHFDGPQMWQGEYFEFTDYAFVEMTPDQFHNLHYIDFGGDC